MIKHYTFFLRLILIIIGLCSVKWSFSQSFKVKEIQYIGLKKTKKNFIKKVSKIEEGKFTTDEKIKEDIRFLKLLPAIAKVDYKLENTENQEVKIVYTFEENFTIIPGIAVWTSVLQTTYRVGVSEFNLFGQSIAVGGFYQNNGFNSYGVNISAPFLFSKKVGIESNFLSWTSKEPLFFDEGSANYKYTNQSYEIIGLYRPNNHHRFRFGINFLEEQYKYIDGFVPSDAPINLSERKLLLKTGYQYNDINLFYYFVSGIKVEFTFQSLLNRNDFKIFWNDFFYYKRIGKKGNLASRIRFGLSTNSDSPFAPFALDNNVNIRGVGNIIDRGTGTLVTNVEYRYTLYEKEKIAVQGNLFFDGGGWRRPGGTFDDFTQNNNVRLYSGLGARFILKKVFGATFRVDYGMDIKNPFEGGIVFGLGQYF